MSRFASLLAGTVMLAATFTYSLPVAQAQVTPDGGTATGVTIAGDGRITVDIAPVGASQISRNTFTDFSVPLAGVDLNNTLIGARTILSEVTSANRSFINGPVEIVGQRAHFILANPNGITVDGGRFINTGGVTLNAGTAALVAAGGQTNVVTTTHPDADILIGPGGLSGAMTGLQLAAGQLSIDGPVVNENTSPFAQIAALAGNIEISHDSTVLPGSTLQEHATITDLPGASDAILVDVTPRGSLTASRVAMRVSADGAGVSFAGNGLASLGTFRIDTRGHVAVGGGVVRAEADLSVRAESVAVLNAPARQGNLESLSGAVTIIARQGDIALEGRITGVRMTGGDPDSRGGTTLIAARDIRLLSENADRLAIAFASDGDLVAEAGRSIVNRNGRLLSNARIDLRAAVALDNLTDRLDDASATTQVVRGRRTWFSFIFGRPRTTITTQRFASLRIPGEQASIAGASVFIVAPDIHNSGNIFSLDGPMVIDTARLTNQGNAGGELRLVKRCRLTCWSRGFSTAQLSGGAINSAIGLSIEASAYILNDGGSLLALGNLELEAPRIENRAMFLPAIASPPGGMRNFFVGRKAIFAMEPFGGSMFSSQGELRLTSPAPVLSDGGTFTGAVGVFAPGGIDSVRSRLPIGGVAVQRIGLFEGWLP